MSWSMRTSEEAVYSKVYQAYIGSSKSISLSVEEILVREVDRKESYFADESDESNEETEED